ncbi:MAG: hypothetical protein KGJ86_12880 [Chloroflexota bacterium]|nr:hypothetical protein [Chloroflexota bacterium]
MPVKHQLVDIGYAFPFLLSFAVVAAIVLLFIHEGWALIHVPDLNLGSWLSLPGHVPTPSSPVPGH